MTMIAPLPALMMRSMPSRRSVPGGDLLQDRQHVARREAATPSAPIRLDPGPPTASGITRAGSTADATVRASARSRARLQAQPVGGAIIRSGHQRPGESQARGLAQPPLRLRDQSQLARQPDLAEAHEAVAAPARPRWLTRSPGTARGRPPARPGAPRRRWTAYTSHGRQSTSARRSQHGDEQVAAAGVQAAGDAAWVGQDASGRPAPGPRRPAAAAPPARSSPRRPRCRRACRRRTAARRPRRRPGRAPVISKQPTSPTAPKRFLVARTSRSAWWRSPSISHTASTRCSSTRGPASCPSLVTCPTSTVAMPLRLAAATSAAAQSRTWVDAARRTGHVGTGARLDGVDDQRRRGRASTSSARIAVHVGRRWPAAARRPGPRAAPRAVAPAPATPPRRRTARSGRAGAPARRRPAAAASTCRRRARRPAA